MFDLPTAILVLSISAPVTVTIAGFFAKSCVKHYDRSAERLQAIAVAVGRLEATVEGLRQIVKHFSAQLTRDAE